MGSDKIGGELINLVIDPEEMTSDFLELNPQIKSKLLDRSFFLNPQILNNYSVDEIESILFNMRDAYIKEVRKSDMQDIRERRRYDAQYQ